MCTPLEIRRRRQVDVPPLAGLFLTGRELNKAQIILALDVDTLEEAKDFVDKLYPKIKIFKVSTK